MKDAERVLYELLSKLGLAQPVRAMLKSRVTWRMSGLTFLTAAIATTGTYMSPQEYHAEALRKMRRLDDLVPEGSSVLDFGTGLGGNLLGLADKISEGVGLDINPFFIQHAVRLARRFNHRNLRFLSYDGERIPTMGTFDVVLSIGTFERIPKITAKSLVHQLARNLKPDGVLLLHFLTDRVRSGAYSRLLGPDAYSFWSDVELDSVMNFSGLKVNTRIADVVATGDLMVLGRSLVSEA